MLRHAISHARLMRESTDCVQTALNNGDSDQQLVARRILENPSVWHHWETEHSSLMRQLANCGLRHTQIAALKHTTFRLLHGKALFQYLRSSEVRGEQRAQVIAHFRPGRSYEHAIVAEHNLYIRKACSYLCANHVGGDVIEDPMFLDPMQRYEELYAEYFNVYCSTLVRSPDGDATCQQALLPLLKKQLNEYRWAILDPRRAQPFLRREAELRLPAGDTQRMPALGSKPRDRR
jgi:hypothetical protein